MGFGVISLNNQENENKFVMTIYQESFNSIMIALMSAIIVVYCISLYFSAKKRKLMEKYLYSIFNDHKTTQKIMLQYYIQKALILFIISSIVLLAAMIYISSTTYFGFENTDFILIVIALCFSLFYEVIVPVVIGGLSHD